MANYYDSALSYLRSYYQTATDSDLSFGYGFIEKLSEECVIIGQQEGLKDADFSRALIATCFRYAGVTNIFANDHTGLKLLQDFTEQASYPPEQVAVIREMILHHLSGEAPTSSADYVTWDALDYRLAMDDLIMQTTSLIDETERSVDHHAEELSIFMKLRKDFTTSHYRTNYAKKHYTQARNKNQERVDKRIQRLTLGKNISSAMSDKETEDLFKIAFRNYVKLVDVADSKAALLIHINSILISVVIGFVVSRSEKYPVLTIPAFMILGVAFLTILLGILASRPQRNSSMRNKSSKSYQTFFFGSFDLIDTNFRDADFDTYSKELDAFFNGGKEKVYAEIYKEVFNVRKVLANKFSYLSYAYLVFLVGLLLSIVAFFLATQHWGN